MFGGAGDDTMNGGAGNDQIYGQSGSDTLNGAAGNDILTGGDGDDTFVFTNGHGADSISDFTAGAGSDDDIDLSGHSAVGDFGAVQAAAGQVGADTVIDLGDGDTITLLGVNVGTLHQDDFLF